MLDNILDCSDTSIHLDSVLQCIPANPQGIQKCHLKASSKHIVLLEEVSERFNYWKRQIGRNDLVHCGWNEEAIIDGTNLDVYMQKADKIQQLFDDKK